jgi:hypothetical protein
MEIAVSIERVPLSSAGRFVKPACAGRSSSCRAAGAVRVPANGAGRRVVATGYANWTPLAISLWRIGFGFARLLIGLFVVMYFVQLRRFHRVAQAVVTTSDRERGGHP